MQFNYKIKEYTSNLINRAELWGRLLTARMFYLSVIAILSVTGIIVLSSSANAADIVQFNDMSPSQQAKAWIYYNSLSKCIREEGLITQGLTDTTIPHARITESNANAGQWFSNGEINGWGSTNPTIGYFLKGSGAVLSINGEIVGCGGKDVDWIIDAAHTFGYRDGIDMLCDTGAKRKDDSSCRDSKTGSFFVGSDHFKLNLDTFQNNIKARIGNVFDNLSKAAEYILYRNAFFAGCLGNSDPYTGTEKDRVYTIQFVDERGLSSDPISYMGKLKQEDKISFYVDSRMDNISKTCGDIATVINNDADAYKTTVAIVRNDGTSGDTKPIGVTTDSTSYCNIEKVGWIVCPVLSFLGSIADVAFNFLADNLLRTKTSFVDTESTTYDTWSAIRNLANIAFVIVFLIIIFSQMTSVGITNYGIKKMLPRLIIAAILVNLSFFICQIAVDLSNILGYSIKDSFESIGQYAMPKSIEGVDQSRNGFGIAALVAGGALAGIGVLLAISVPVLIAVITALFMVVLILVARMAFIILLVVISPLAFVAYLLPNTEQWFKKWYKAFASILLVFPIIALLFGAGNLAARVISDNAKGDKIMQMVAIGVAVVPLFAVPTLLKSSMNAAGSIGTKMAGWSDKANGRIGTKINDTSRLGAMKQHYQNQATRSRQLVQSGSYKGINPVSRGLSAMNRAINRSPLSGSFGQSRAAAGITGANKLDNDAVDAQAALIQSQGGALESIKVAKERLLSSINSGDVIGARAAQKVLLGSGGAGRDALQSTLGGVKQNDQNRGVMNNLRGDILSAGLKSTHAALNKFGSTDKDLSEIENDSSVLSGLTQEELAGQSYNSLLRTNLEGISNKTIVSMFSNNQLVTSKITDDKLALFTQPTPEKRAAYANEKRKENERK